ncbi:MAG: hypothetical protein ABID04_01925 [Patescibacteria group bacterium]
MARKEISLLPQEGLAGTYLGRIFNWLSSVGRYIIIFTELIVVGAFLSRFWLDRTNSDLSAEIRQEEAILKSTTPFEKEFRLFQTRMDLIAKANAQETDFLRPLDLISASLPMDLLLLQYSYNNNPDKDPEASVLVLAYSEASLAGFANNLLEKDEVSSVKIGTIEKEEGSSGMKIQFLIKFNFKNG